MSLPTANPQPDTPEARRYNRIKRLLELADLALGVGFLVVLLVTGWTNRLRDISMRTAGDHYWLQLFIFFTQIAPVVLFPLFYKFVPLQNEELKDRLMRLGERAGKRIRGVYEWKLSEKTKKANAALTGLGHTRRIIVGDTLLQNYTE